MTDEQEDTQNSIAEEEMGPTKPKSSTSRRILLAAAIAAGLIVLIFLGVYVSYRAGVFDNYIKEQFVAKMAEIGVTFSADKFRVTASPMTLELENATFNDTKTGEKLFFIHRARLGLTVLDLLSWRTSRDIRIDTTDIDGAEVWLKFDADGRSNFSNLHFIENEAGSAVNFRYESVVLVLKDSTFHFGDITRSIAANGNNVSLSLTPETVDAADNVLRFRFALLSENSDLTYDERAMKNISIAAQGLADNTHAQIDNLAVSSPVGQTLISGTITDWSDPHYDLNVESSIDLTQLSQIFATGTSLVGAGTFKGRITGAGENYKIDGEANSGSLRANGVYLKGANINATINGTNSNYTANGTAIAQMLTFDDFRLDFLKLAGNVRGTGTDFRWVGELQALAAKSPTMAIGGLFLSDAMAEYHDRELQMAAGSGRAKRFAIGDTEFDDLRVRNARFAMPNGDIAINASSASAGKFATKAISVAGVTGSSVAVKHASGTTDVNIKGLRATSGTLGNAKMSGVSADSFALKDRPKTTSIDLKNVNASRVDLDGAQIDGVSSPDLSIENAGEETIVYSDSSRVAKIDTDAAVLGTLNIAGVRMTIKNGYVEARSADFDAGSITLKKSAALENGGQLEDVKVARPVFILEPSGRYRASADMSIGGGALGSVSLGSATAKVVVDNTRATLEDLNATVMDGSVTGRVSVAFSPNAVSNVDTQFTGLDLSKLLAIQGGRVVPLEGKTDGEAVLTFAGTNFRTASGHVKATVQANAGTADRGLIPIDGKVDLQATNGLFAINEADLHTAESSLTATGDFDLKNNGSNLRVDLRSTDAAEIEHIVRVTGISPELERQLDDLRAEVGGNLAFNGTLTGNIFDPEINGHASIGSVALRGHPLGSLSADLLVSAGSVELQNGKLEQPGGGSATFTVKVPGTGSNNTSVEATLEDIDAGSLLAALPIDLPGRINDLQGSTSGNVMISGLPNLATGQVDLSAAKGTIAGQAFDTLKAKATFNGTVINVETAEMNVGNGSLKANGRYDRGNGDFNADVTGKSIPLPLLLAILPPNASIPAITGDANVTLTATGNAERLSSIVVSGTGTATGVAVGDSTLGDVAFDAKTEGGRLTANLTASFDGRPQTVTANLDLNNESLPLTASTAFNDSPLAPFLAFIPQLKGVPLTGTGTGTIDFGGDLSSVDATGKRVISANGLSGTARFSALNLRLQDTPLSAAEPIVIRFDPNAITFVNAKFTGGGSNMTIAGTKAISDSASNDLAVDGRINLALANLFVKDIFFAGSADVSMRLAGPNATAKLIGSVTTDSAAVAAFVGNDRLTFERVKARVIFTSDQAEIEEASGYLGGGRFTASGGALLDGLSLKNFRVSLNGSNVTVPFPEDFLTTGDAKLELTGIKRNPSEPIQVTLAGRVYASRSLYSKDIDLANIVGGRRERALSAGSSSLGATRFDLVIEGRDALVVRNNIADLTASVSLSVTGDSDNPIISGRITANGGTLLYSHNRYEIQRGVLEFPPDTFVDPIINLQAEADIGGYQVFVNLNGPLNETEQLNASVRSSPALPQADIVSLITTGSLTNAAGGIPTLAQTGIRTAAEILTDAVINNPARRATDKLFGLNVFEIDPIISGEQLDPGARLTVGRQINRNLRVTYSTNLSQDQNQVLALEYRVSNKLSFVAQYEQRSLSNVTRNRDNFSFEIRFKRRF